MRTAILAVLAVAAAAAPAAAKKAHVPPVLPADLAVFSEHGVQIGAKVLYAKPVDGAGYDAAQDLIWLVSQRQLLVIDLRDAHPTAVVIAKNLPDQLDSFGVTGWSAAAHDTADAGTYPQFEVGAKKVTVSVEIGARGGVDEAADQRAMKAIEKIKIVGTKWIAAHADRTPRAIPEKRADPPTVTLPPGRGVCESIGMCGNAAWLGDSPYQAVLITQTCDKTCRTACVLYDPKTQRYAPAAGDGTWGALGGGFSTMACLGYQAEPGGGDYFGLSGDGVNMLCTLGAGPMTCVDTAPWEPFAWVSDAHATAPAR